MRISHAIIIFILLIAAVLSWQIDLPIEVAPEPSINMAERKADYYLESFIITETGSSGKAETIIAGDTLTHYPADRTADINRPFVEVRGTEASAHWVLRAKKGILQEQGNIITLVGDVSLERKENDAQEPIRVETQSLSIYLDKNYVETDQPIEVKAKSWSINAGSLQSDLNKDHLTLFKRVQGQYETNIQ